MMSFSYTQKYRTVRGESMQSKNMRFIIIAVIIAMLSAVGGGAYVMKFGNANQEDSEQNDDEKTVGEIKLDGELGLVQELIQNNYIEEIDDSTLIEGAIQGMLETLDDPYSTYMDEEMVKQFEEQIESSFQGIGAEVGMEDGKVTIISPIQGSPAEKIGLRSKDKILEIDEEGIEGLDLLEAVDKIRGEKGSKVKLTIERAGAKKPFDVEVVRDEIPIETVYASMKEKAGNKTGILKLTNFSDDTAKDFKNELEQFEDDKVDGLVIDVRGNPGGLLNVVEDILKDFVPKDTPFLQIEDRDGNKEPYYSKLEEKKDYPIVVLADEGSASASEILAVALKEIGYDVVGTTTYGKGTVQQALEVDDNVMVKLTSFKWLSPEGTWVHEDGVEPTVEVKQPEYYYTHPITVEETYKYDQADEAIGNIQQMLKGLGYEVDRMDGYFSKDTEAAVKSFQESEDLKTSGEIDEKTAELLEAKILEKIRDEKDDKQLEKALETLYK